jgi:hypothetical protein
MSKQELSSRKKGIRTPLLNDNLPIANIIETYSKYMHPHQLNGLNYIINTYDECAVVTFKHDVSKRSVDNYGFQISVSFVSFGMSGTLTINF